MANPKKVDLLEFLKLIIKKGYYDVLLHVEKNPDIHYNDVLKWALEKKVVASRSALPPMLGDLTDLGLLDRTITDTRPIRTTYKVSKKGKDIIKSLDNLQKNLK